jgi:FtsP/CotA-like multicopper oxidase with cupredoxin domain
MNRLSASLPAAAFAALFLPVVLHGQPNLAGGSARPPRILPNDNREPAGVLEDDVLTLRLTAGEGMWHPEGFDHDGIRIGAFAEEGGPLEIPGPLIRIPLGTEVRTTVRNTLSRPLAVFGLGAERGVSGDSVLVEPDGVAEFAFVAREPGTYYYLGRTQQPGVPDPEWTGSLHGAIVVDPPGAVGRPGDRVFVISSWFTFDTTNFSDLSSDAVIAANGLAWPFTEVVEAAQGDSLEWRWINLTSLDHPMHLHGFHFRVDARGGGVRDTLYPADRRQLAVTEYVGPGHTATTVWSPDRSGNWIFHCHMLSHMSSIALVNTPLAERARHEGHMMGGLVVGVRVRPSGIPSEEPAESRALRLLIRSRPGVYGEDPGYAYVLGGSPEEEDPSALPVPGPTLVLEKGRRVGVTLVNESHEPAAVHWHGIELESYPDGVPGWSGEGERLLPSIPPGDSLTVYFMPPRAGTFMYHSHFNEMQQTSSGLYGPIVVLEPGATFDPETDRVLVFSDGGPVHGFLDPNRPTLLNGRVQPAPLELRVGETYRFRLINILTESGIRVELLKGEEPVEWRAVAKDGADLPPSLATIRPARLGTMPGEIYDFAFTPDAPGELVLAFGKDEPETFTRVAVRVR